MAKRSYAKKFHCKYCGKGFSFYETMEDHINIVHRDSRIGFGFEDSVEDLGSIFQREVGR